MIALALIAFGAAFLVTLVTTPLVRAVALRTHQVAPEREDRFHETPTPVHGGVAIILGLGTGLLIGYFAFETTPPLFAIIPAAGLFVLGFLDDVFEWSVTTKLAGQLVCVLALFPLGFDALLFGIPVLDAVLAVAFLMAATNALNLIDNMDGLSSGTVLMIGTAVVALALLDGPATTLIVATALVGAVTGFLVWNFPPARIFMGDGGSLPLGFLIGLLALQPSAWEMPLLLRVLVPVLLLLVPFFDVAFVSLVRAAEARPISRGGTDHTSHHLVALGLDVRQAILLLWALAGLAAGSVVLGRTVGPALTAILGGGILLFLVGIGLYLKRRLPVSEPVESGPRTALAIRLRRLRGLSVLLDAAFIALAAYLATFLRFEGPDRPWAMGHLARALPGIVTVKLVIFLLTGRYRHPVARPTMRDALRLARPVLFAQAATFLYLLAVYRFIGYSRTAFVIDGLLLFGLLLLARFAFRIFDVIFPGPAEEGTPSLLVVPIDPDDRDRVLALLRLFQNDVLPGYWIVGVISTDSDPPTPMFQGLPVLGSLQDEDLEERLRPTEATHLIVPKLKKEAEKDLEIPPALTGQFDEDHRLHLTVDLQPIPIPADTREDEPAVD